MQYARFGCSGKKAGVQIIGGPFLNIFNSVSLSEIQKLGAAECVLSYEMTLKQLTALEENVGAVFASTAEYRLCSQEIVR